MNKHQLTVVMSIVRARRGTRRSQTARKKLLSGMRASMCVALLLVAQDVVKAETTSAPDPDPARFEDAIEAYAAWDAKNAVPHSPIVFIGSSSIRMWRSAAAFPDLPVINRGFGGSQISDVNHYAEQLVLKHRPAAVVFYAGDNDIAAGKSPAQVAEDFTEFVHLVRSRLPESEIIYLPIKPSVARWKLWPQMQQANKRIAELAEQDEHLQYVDIATPMLDDEGRPRQQLFLKDGLHLSREGYRVWEEALRPVFDKLSAGN